MIESISSKDFHGFFKDSTLVATKTIHYRITRNKKFCMGFIVHRSLGPAYKRNLFKRRMRSLCCGFFGKQNVKFSVIITPKTINLTWFQILNSFDLMKNELHNI